jgi:hypothetical protein
LWQTLDPSKWNNPNKEKETRREWYLRNIDKIRRYKREWSMKKRRELGIPYRGSNIRSRYENLEDFKKQLESLYWDKGLSWRKVAKALHLSTSCVDKWRRFFKIPSRPRNIAVSMAMRCK